MVNAISTKLEAAAGRKLFSREIRRLQKTCFARQITRLLCRVGAGKQKVGWRTFFYTLMAAGDYQITHLFNPTITILRLHHHQRSG